MVRRGRWWLVLLVMLSLTGSIAQAHRTPHHEVTASVGVVPPASGTDPGWPPID
jgi:hypothetical protein